MELRELSVEEFADRVGDPKSVTINVHVPVGESIEGTDAVVPYDDIEDSDSLLKDRATRSEEHTSELQSLMRISYAVFCLKKKKYKNNKENQNINHKKQY